MQRNTIWFGSVLATGVVALGACIGTMDGEGETEPVGESVQLVAQRRDWLKNYDNHCDSCFKAFELCEKGAADELQEDACQVALDACVRGGLKDKNDAGVVDEDAEVVDEDAGVEDEDAEVEDEEEVEEDEEDVDADIDEDEEEVDEEEVDEEDAGVDEEEEEEEIDEDVDAGIDDEEEEEEVDEAAEEADAAKQQLIADVEICLDQARECVDADAENAQQCVLETVTCIQAALEKAFDVICAEQIENVQAKQGKGARQAEAQLRGICEQNLAL